MPWNFAEGSIPRGSGERRAAGLRGASDRRTTKRLFLLLALLLIPLCSVCSGPSAEVTIHVLNVNETLLNCSICNFYPVDLDASWMKDGENWDQETFRGDIIRNWDGTYCTWISIEINPMEEYSYRCYVEHEGLQKAFSVEAPTVIIPTEENFQPLFIICCVVSALVILNLLAIIIGILWYNKCQRDYRPGAKGDPNSSLDNAEKCPLKEIGVSPLNNTAGEESKGGLPTSQDTGEKKQPPENHQISI